MVTSRKEFPMYVNLPFGNPENPDAIRIIIHENETGLAPVTRDIGGLITVLMAKGTSGRIVSARIAAEVYNSASSLTFWQRSGGLLPATLMPTEAGEVTPLLEIACELTEAFAPEFTPLVRKRYTFQQWEAFNYLASMPHSAMDLAPRFGQGMTFGGFYEELGHVHGDAVVTLLDRSSGLLIDAPKTPQHLVGVQMADGRMLTLPLELVTRITSLQDTTWTPDSEQVFCTCSDADRRWGFGVLHNSCRVCGYQIPGGIFGVAIGDRFI